MKQALILGGTKGLGREIALKALDYEVVPIVVGRSALQSEGWPQDKVRLVQGDLCDQKSASCIAKQLGDVSQVSYVFDTAGVELHGKLIDHSPEEIERAFGTMVTGPMYAIREFHRMKSGPYHLVTVASTTSWKIRSDETVYGAAKAAQAQFARGFHRELLHDLPGSKSLLIHPGGMRTPFWNNSGKSTTDFMDPTEIADAIWKEVNKQKEDWSEVHMLRGRDGKPVIERGARAPQ